MEIKTDLYLGDCKTELKLKDVPQYVEDNIGTFHQKRISSLDSLGITKILQRKNPYLFKAKYVLTAGQIVKGLVEAHISSIAKFMEERNREKTLSLSSSHDPNGIQ